MPRNLQPDAGVEEAVCEVGEEVGQDVGYGDDEDAGLDLGVVATADRVHHQRADALP